MIPKPFEASIQTSLTTFNGSNHDQMNQKQCQMITKIVTLIHMFMWCQVNAMLIMKSCVKWVIMNVNEFKYFILFSSLVLVNILELEEHQHWITKNIYIYYAINQFVSICN
jgi:hypothetical protein